MNVVTEDIDRVGTIRINACGDSRLRGLRNRKV